MNKHFIKFISAAGGVFFFFRRKKIKREHISKILIISLYFRGDVVLNTPAIRALRKIFPDADIDVWVKSRSADILRGNENVSAIIQFDNIRTADYEESSSNRISDKLGFLRKIRKSRYDLCIDLTGKYSTALFALLGGFRYSAGLNYNGFGFCYSSYADIDTQNSPGHLSAKYCSIVKSALSMTDEEWNTVTGNDISADYLPDIGEADSVSKYFKDCGIGISKPLICMQTTAGWKAKEWEPENYSSLISMIRDRFDTVLIGGESDKEYNARIIERAGLDSGHLLTSISLARTSAAISLAQLFIGSDSVGLQLAGAMGIPTIALFGPTNPLFSNPPGRDHRVIYRELECSALNTHQYCSRNAGKTCGTLECMKSITVEEVIHEIESLMIVNSQAGEVQ